MKRFLSALASALVLAGCQVEPATLPGTVLSVQETRQHLPEELLKFDDDNLRIPEVAWKVEVQLDDGSHVTAITTGGRPTVTPADAWTSLATALAAQQSATTGTTTRPPGLPM